MSVNLVIAVFQATVRFLVIVSPDTIQTVWNSTGQTKFVISWGYSLYCLNSWFHAYLVVRLNLTHSII